MTRAMTLYVHKPENVVLAIATLAMKLDLSSQNKWIWVHLGVILAFSMTDISIS